ncbi:MAG TPA: hypothetical protein VFC09_04880 [Candidatus Dormibacteraeota bacterium]|nr:hypothetical protein [Candidatus Dormibacteraeota bacterium]
MSSLLLAESPAPNLLYVLGIPAGLLLVAVVICYGVWRAVGRS